jgi:hypothetical protein
MLQVAIVLGYVSTFSCVVPLVLMLIKKERIRKRYLTWLGILLLLSLGTDLISRVVLKFNLYTSTTYLINFYNILQFIIVLLIYYELYLKEKKMVVVLAAVVYFGFEIANSISSQTLNLNQTWSWAFNALIFVTLSCGFFKYLLDSRPVENIAQYSPAIINAAFFAYFGFSLYLFLWAEYAFSNLSNNAAIVFWAFHNFNNIAKNCLFAAGIYYAGAKK